MPGIDKSDMASSAFGLYRASALVLFVPVLLEDRMPEHRYPGQDIYERLEFLGYASILAWGVEG